ncbi:YqbF domain-containing protein [Brevibacillus sp. SYSU BS000544]|uniref:YqbF domain-containing protein n=1 Tax=Brevibacillus sp. SYSU BS000544 TaxID=3416443 RepID=UPI003CE4C484
MWAKLVHGKNYYVFGLHFHHGIPQEVDKDIYDYLKGNPQFEIGDGCPDVNHKSMEAEPVRTSRKRRSANL